MKTKILSLISITFVLAMNSAAQLVTMMPFGVHESALIEQIKSLRSSNPKITAAELAKSANELFTKNGIAFKIYFDVATCQKIRAAKQSQKDPNAPIKLGTSLQSVGAHKASLALPQPILPPPQCGNCYVEMAILEMTDTEFVTLIQGQNIKFQLPANFSVNRAYLLDNKETAKKIRTWRIPYRATPIGVSYDQTVVYLGFESPELSALSLAVFDSGVFEITTRHEAEEGGFGKPDKSIKTVETDDQVINFTRWETQFLVSYKSPC